MTENRPMINRIKLATSTTELPDRSADGTSEGSRLVRAVKTIERFIATKPEICLGVALSLGVVTGWIIKRRN
jgi:ElaB/YqjD/DUF883 family membrane-anchored ribosome-binding protein